MEDLGWKGEAGVKPRSPKGRAVARGLDARIHFQHLSSQRETLHPNHINQSKSP